MIKVLQIREAPLTKCAGIDANCQALVDLFEGDNSVDILPPINYTKHIIPILHQCYLDKKEICGSIERLKPDIIHIHGAYSFTLWVAVKCAEKYRLPIVFSPHFHPFWALRRPLMGRIYFNVITKNVLRHIRTVFTINLEDTGVFKEYHKNVIKIPHCVKFNIPLIKPKKKTNMILFVGRLNESNKGLDYLYHLPIGKYEIHCVGKGELFPRKDFIKHTNISEVELLGLYQQASLLVVPSRYEAFSYVTLEALANYTPVVVSDRVRIIDYLGGFAGIQSFKYQDYGDFIGKVEQTIGKNVDANEIMKIFSRIEIKNKYKKAYLEAAEYL